jgi:hypothetical protein
MSLSVVRGSASGAHSVPQRQHVPSWLAIGARQERHKRGKCRWRRTLDPLGSIVRFGSILATFPSADHR